MGYLFSGASMAAHFFFMHSYWQLTKGWKTVKNQALARAKGRHRFVMTPDLLNAIKRGINDYNQISIGLNGFNNACALNYFYLTILSMPCNCFGLYLIIYLKSSLSNWIIAVGGTTTLSLLWAGFFLLSSAINHQVDIEFF